MQEITRQLKDKILYRDNYKCAYCLEVYEPSQLHIDHIQPKSKGGSNLPINLITACKNCNLKKHNKILENPPVVASITLEDGDLVEGFTYPIFSIRLSNEVWEQLKKARMESGLSWNLFIKELLKKKP